MPTGVWERKPLVDRFWEKVEKTKDCWNWKGCRNFGYGIFDNKGTTARAHRFAYELLVGLIPEGFEIDHLCKNKACVNPGHLEVVTHKENILRGISFAAKEARLTHCPQGHPYDLFNTHVNKKGWRFCRACNIAWKRKHRLTA